MLQSFNPQEILKIAINVEKNGRDLYEALEQRTNNEKIKKIWGFLKDQEDEHVKVFQDILDNVGEFVVNGDNSSLYESYLKAVASEYIFSLKVLEDKLTTNFASDLEAIDFAIGMEKESILVYSELRQYIITEKQGALDKIIDEERKHLVQFVELKYELQGM